MELNDLIDRLRAWARRYEPRSPERMLFLESAEKLETMTQRIAESSSGELTVEAIEAAIGGPLVPWQKDRLEKNRQTPPPSSVA